MLNPDDLLELGRERQRMLISWRTGQRRPTQHPSLELVIITLLHRAIATIIGKLKLLRQARAAALTSATKIRRALR